MAPLLGGLALGGLAVGAGLLAKNAQNQAASRAAAAQNQQSMLAFQQAQQQRQLLEQQQAQDKALTDQKTQQISSTIGDPIKNPGGLTPSPLNDPIFDTSTLKTGRNTLLGN